MLEENFKLPFFIIGLKGLGESKGYSGLQNLVRASYESNPGKNRLCYMEGSSNFGARGELRLRISRLRRLWFRQGRI